MSLQRTCNLPSLAKPYFCAPIARPLPGAVFSSFVNMLLVVNGKQISVGNKSSPFSGNSAFIKSFSHSACDGNGFKVEIVDTSGGDFTTFISLLNTDACSASGQEAQFLFEFGWLITSCSGQIYKYGTSEVARAGILDVDATTHPKGFLVGQVMSQISAENANGIWKYNLTIADISAQAAQTRSADPIGSDSHKVPFKQGCNRALKPDRNCKQRTLKKREHKVLFYRRNSNDTISKFDFLPSDGGEQGPKSIWNPDRTDPLTAIRSWTNSLTTDRKQGMFFVTTPTLIDGNVILMESNQDECLLNGSTCEASSASQIYKVYIVNGGDCSPVISFDPKIEFQAFTPQGGGIQGPLGSRPIKTRSCGNTSGRKFKSTNMGVQTQVQVPVSNLHYRSPDDAGDKEARGLGANAAASKQIEGVSNMEVDLVVQGDPTYIGMTWVGKQISIIYLNPPAPKSNGFACDWLATPTVNAAFSKTNYLIKSVNHQIGEDGKYTTTLKVSTIPNEKTSSV
jgi:hypothetical protein